MKKKLPNPKKVRDVHKSINDLLKYPNVCINCRWIGNCIYTDEECAKLN